ncbi:MAG: TonB-dependent receptor [Bacteroidetes bacterium]|nr:TonB-dependent receptor [Bacteroidota bacterium]
MNYLSKKIFITIILGSMLLITSASYSQNNTGSITGVVKDASTNVLISYVNVRLSDTPYGAATNIKGEYSIVNVPTGKYRLIASSVGYQSFETGIEIVENKQTRFNISIKPTAFEVGEVYVYGASLRRERLTEAPSAITVIEAKEIARYSGHGQLAKLLEMEAGVNIVQSGLYDFNITTRGFNSSLNRRLLILLDGRDLGTAFLGATEWNGLSIPLEELGRIELVRGPGSALYGANAYSGVINISSIPPKQALGTRVNLGVGELSAYRADVRHAGTFGSSSYRVNLGFYQGKTFSKIRKGRQFEYAGLDPIFNDEVLELNLDPVRSIFGSVRFDHEFQSSGGFTVEGGMTQIENEVIVTGIGRVQVEKAARPWARLNFNKSGFNVLIWANGRYNVESEQSLATGLPLTQDALITHGEVQYSFSTLEDKLFIVTGISQRFLSIDTKGSLMLNARDDNMSGIFAQAEYKFTDNFKGVVAARWDRSTLYPGQYSPKAALVWTPINGHTFRATINKAFQAPNYSEQYLRVLHPTRAVAYFGNFSLVPEEILGYEIGYKGIIDNKLFLTLDGYYNEMKEFITDLGPGLNPLYPGPVYFPDENKSRNIWSYTNAGKVNEAGAEFSFHYYLNDSWLFEGNATYFTFEVAERHPNDVLLPNAPKYKGNVGLTFIHPAGHEVSLRMKYVPAFPWAAGIFRGEIYNYTLLNFFGTYKISNMVSVNVNVSNLLDKKHYEIFGGSILSRRAMLTINISF